MNENIIQYILIAVALFGAVYIKNEGGEDESSRDSNIRNDNNSSDSVD